MQAVSNKKSFEEATAEAESLSMRTLSYYIIYTYNIIHTFIYLLPYLLTYTHLLLYALLYIELNYLSKPPLVDWVRTVLTYAHTLPSTAPPLIFQQLFETESSTYTYILADPSNSKYIHIFIYCYIYTILLYSVNNNVVQCE